MFLKGCVLNRLVGRHAALDTKRLRLCVIAATPVLCGPLNTSTVSSSLNARSSLGPIDPATPTKPQIIVP